MKNLALFLLLLAACTPAAGPTAGPSPAAIPTFNDNLLLPATGTPAAEPTIAPSPTAVPTFDDSPVTFVRAHEWSQWEPLITYSRGRSRMTLEGRWTAAYPMDFILLPGGDLYLLRSNQDLHAEQILTTTLSRQAICDLLNSIDRTGYFDHDLSTYSGITGMDVTATQISVHGWRANATGLRGLPGPLAGEPTGQPGSDHSALLAVEDTRQLLDQYQPPGTLQVLLPGRLGIWIQGSPGGMEASPSLTKWPLASFPLSDAARTQAKENNWNAPAIVLTGADATELYDALHKAVGVLISQWFREGSRAYDVFVRPLMPYEYNWSARPQVSLSCP